MRTAGVRPLADILRVVAGPAVWFAHFVTLYGAEAILCTPPASASGAMPWVGSVATVAALALLIGFAATGLRATSSHDLARAPADAAFLRGATRLLSLLATLAVIWTAVPITLIAPCGLPAG